MNAAEMHSRLVLAQERKKTWSNNSNCVGFLLFVVGIIDKETFVSPNAHRVKQNLTSEKVGIITIDYLVSLPDLATLTENVVGLGVWNTLIKTYLHMAYLDRFEGNLVLYERFASGFPIEQTTLEKIISYYLNNEGEGATELRVLRKKNFS